ncbi:hypothetical protein IAT40_003215 [Kwoniella sp. CBS 6097]
MSFASTSKRGLPSLARARNIVSSSSSSSASAINSVSHARPQLAFIQNGTVLQAYQHQQQQQQQQHRSFFSLPDITKLANLVPGQGQSSSNAGPDASSAQILGGRGGDTSGSGSSSIETDGEVQRFHARKILPYSQTQLYSLVSDVPSYSSFIPFCNSSTVLSRPAPSPSSSPTTTTTSTASTMTGPLKGKELANWTPGTKPFEVLAELAVGFGGLEERYVSKVVGKPFESVTATATKQTPLFKSLITRWSFAPASSQSPHPSFNPTSTSPTPTRSSASSSSSSSPSPSEPVTPGQQSSQSPDVGPTLLTIDLAFNFANPLHRIASQAVLPKVADKMIEAFEKRCLKVYGKGTE